MLLKKNEPRNLHKIDVWAEDTGGKYFEIAGLPDLVEAGKSSFLLALPANTMKLGSEILVEIIDSAGNPVYVEFPRFLEGTSRRVSIFVYPKSYGDDATPPGLATMTILGEALDVPNSWKGMYNVRWTSRFIVDPTQENTAPIRFYSTPKLSIREDRYSYKIPVWTDGHTTGSVFDGTIVGSTAKELFNTTKQDSGKYNERFGKVWE